jgi:RNA-directed DNA polymerase
MGQALAQHNMAAAWKRVKANKGSAGVDGRTVQQTGEDLKTQWPDIRRSLFNDTYRPSPVRRVGIPKPGGGTRELGIPTVVDRLIQQALLQVLQPLIDPTFSEHSYGLRPGRSAHQAVQAARRYVEQGRCVVVDVDLEKFFDRVNHDILMDRLGKRIADKAVLRLIRHDLNAGIMANGVMQMRVEGARRKVGRCRRCWPTCCSTRWTANSNAGGTNSCATRTIATSTSRASVPGNGCWTGCAPATPSCG